MNSFFNNTIIKQSMATGKRAFVPGNYGCGAFKFRLVKIDESSEKINKIKESINDAYSADDGTLYFLFAAKNSYSSPMEVNDSNTLERMKEEKAIREAFVDCTHLLDIDKELLKKTILRTVAESVLEGEEGDEEEKKAFVKDYIEKGSKRSFDQIVSALNERNRQYVEPYITENLGYDYRGIPSVFQNPVLDAGYIRPNPG